MALRSDYEFTLGWRQDIEDLDFLHEKSGVVPWNLVGAFKPPKSIDPTPYIDARNQLQESSCSGHGYTLAARFTNWIKTGGGLIDGKIVDLSPQFIYNLGRKEAGITGDRGCTITGVVMAGKKYGVCREQTMPYTGRDNLDIPREAFEEGEQHLMRQNSPLYSYNDIFNGLAAGLGGVVIGIDWVESLAHHMETDEPIEELSGESYGKHCLSGETMIPLLNGTSMSMKDLAEGKAGDKFWVYSCDKSGNIVPGQAFAARKTASMQKVFAVVLDNGEVVKATSDHPFMMRDGSYRNVSELKAGDSLMPLYRRVTSAGPMPGYEQLYNPHSRRWYYTHRHIGGIRGNKRIPKGTVFHHKDFNKRNNEPENIELMTWEEHTKLHADQMDVLFAYRRSEAGRENSRRTMKRLWANPEWAARSRARLKANARKRVEKLVAEHRCGFQAMDKDKLRKIVAANGRKLKGRRRSQQSIEKAKETIRRRLLEDAEFREMRSRNARKNFEKYNAEVAAGIRKAPGRPKKTADNHRIIGVVELPDREDVYDLTVEKLHNFATESGVFVHNCVALIGYVDKQDDQGRNYLILGNSHGQKWGRNGFAIVAPNCCRQWCSNNTNEVHLVSDLQEYRGNAGRADWLNNNPSYQPPRW